MRQTSSLSAQTASASLRKYFILTGWMRPRQQLPLPSFPTAVFTTEEYTISVDHPNLVVIHAYGTRPEADLALAALENAGIPAVIQADTAGGMREHLAWSGNGFRILVREEDAPAAREVLAPVSEAPEHDTDY